MLATAHFRIFESRLHNQDEAQASRAKQSTATTPKQSYMSLMLTT